VVRVAVIGRGPWVSLVSKYMSAAERDLAIMSIVRDLGAEHVLLHALYTDKRNLEEAQRFFKDALKGIRKIKGAISSKLVYIMDNPRDAHIARKLEKTLWSRQRIPIEMQSKPPRYLEGVISTKSEEEVYLVTDSVSVKAARLALEGIKESRRVKLTFTGNIKVIVEEGKVKGVRLDGDTHPVDYLVADEETLSHLGFKTPEYLPYSIRVCVSLYGPQLSAALAWPGFLLLPTPRGALVCFKKAGETPSSVVDAIKEVLPELKRRFKGPLPYVMGPLYSRKIVIPPDNTFIVGKLDEGPENIIAVLGCSNSCLSLSKALASSIINLIKGGKDDYSVDRLRTKELFKEYISIL